MSSPLARPWALAGMACLALAALCLWLAQGDRRAHHALVAAGVATQAQVIDRRLHGGGDWWLAYAFRLPDGTELRGQGAAGRVVVTGGNADPYRPGAAVTVRYLPGAPQRNQPDTAPVPVRQIGWVSLGVFTGIVGLSLLSLAFAEAHRPAPSPQPGLIRVPPMRLGLGKLPGSRLLWSTLVLTLLCAGLWWQAHQGPRADADFWAAVVEGRTAEGNGEVTGRSLGSRIVGRELGTGQPRRAMVYFVDYRFMGPDARPRRGQARVFGPEYDRLGAGSPVRVRILRDDPDTHALALAAPVLGNWQLRTLAQILGLVALLTGFLLGRELYGRRDAACSGLVREVTVTGHVPPFLGMTAFRWRCGSGVTGTADAGGRASGVPPVGATVRLRFGPASGHYWLEDAI